MGLENLKGEAIKSFSSLSSATQFGEGEKSCMEN